MCPQVDTASWERRRSDDALQVQSRTQTRGRVPTDKILYLQSQNKQDNMFTFCTLIKAQTAERSTQHGVIVGEALVDSVHHYSWLSSQSRARGCLTGHGLEKSIGFYPSKDATRAVDKKKKR